MASANVTHNLRLGAVRVLLTSPSGGVARDMLVRGQRVANEAKRLVQVDTGRARSTIIVVLVVRDGVPGARIGTNVFYARWIHDGTGIYGPRAALIRPRRGRYMTFRSKKTGTWVRVQFTKGMRGSKFLVRALPKARG